MRPPGRTTACGRAVLFALLLATAAGPAVSSELTEGDLAALQEQLRAGRGRPILVNFWATWCTPCLREIPVLNELQERLADDGLVLLAVSLDAFVYPDAGEARARVERLVADRSFALAGFLYRGDQEALLAAFELPPGLPHTLLLGPDGEVLDRVQGRLEPDEVDRLVGKIRAALAD